MIPVSHRMLVSTQSNARLMVGRGLALPMTSKAASHFTASSSSFSIAAPRRSSTYRGFASDGSLPERHHGPVEDRSSTQRRVLSSGGSVKGNVVVRPQSPLAPIGVQAALEFVEPDSNIHGLASENPNASSASSSSLLLSSDEENAKPALAPASKGQNGENDEHGNETPKPKIFKEFALQDRVGIVSGGNGGLGLEMAVAMCEAGARAIYCLEAMYFDGGQGPRLEYVQLNVTDQKAVWEGVEEIGDREGRMDVCVAAAGILRAHTDCLRYPENQFREVLDVNVNGVLYTAQAAGQQMERFGNRGSIILIASMSATITNRDHAWVSYNTSKSAVLQMARSMACELGRKNIRVNSLSPGHIYTSMTAAYLDKQPHLLEKWSNLNPMGRIGRPDEMRGVCVWLASNASSFCTGSDIVVSGGHHSW